MQLIYTLIYAALCCGALLLFMIVYERFLFVPGQSLDVWRHIFFPSEEDVNIWAQNQSSRKWSASKGGELFWVCVLTVVVFGGLVGSGGDGLSTIFFWFLLLAYLASRGYRFWGYLLIFSPVIFLVIFPLLMIQGVGYFAVYGLITMIGQGAQIPDSVQYVYMAVFLFLWFLISCTTFTVMHIESVRRKLGFPKRKVGIDFIFGFGAAFLLYIMINGLIGGCQIYREAVSTQTSVDARVATNVPERRAVQPIMSGATVLHPVNFRYETSEAKLASPCKIQFTGSYKPSYVIQGNLVSSGNINGAYVTRVVVFLMHKEPGTDSYEQVKINNIEILYDFTHDEELPKELRKKYKAEAFINASKSAHFFGGFNEPTLPGGLMSTQNYTMRVYVEGKSEPLDFVMPSTSTFLLENGGSDEPVLNFVACSLRLMSEASREDAKAR